MPEIGRRALLAGIGSVAVTIPFGAVASSLDAATAIGTVMIDGRRVLFEEIQSDEHWGTVTSQRAVVIVDGEIQVRQIAAYANDGGCNTGRDVEADWSDKWLCQPEWRRTGLVKVSARNWVRVPVLGRVVAGD